MSVITKLKADDLLRLPVEVYAPKGLVLNG